MTVRKKRRKPGAGRPRTGRKPRTVIAISPRYKQLLGEIAGALGLTLHEAANQAVAALLMANRDELRSVVLSDQDGERADQ